MKKQIRLLFKNTIRVLEKLKTVSDKFGKKKKVGRTRRKCAICVTFDKKNLKVER